MKLLVLTLYLASVFYTTNGTHMVVGETENRQVLHHTVAQYPPISNLRRLKYIVYTDLEMRPIRGIDAHDNLGSLATSNVLAGGIGYPFVTIRLKSERSKGLNYDIKIFA